MGLEDSTETGKSISDAQTKGIARIVAIDYVAAVPGVYRTEIPWRVSMPWKENPRSIGLLKDPDHIGDSDEAFDLHSDLKQMHRQSEGMNVHRAPP
jgi:hypothetical protein